MENFSLILLIAAAIALPAHAEPQIGTSDYCPTQEAISQAATSIAGHPALSNYRVCESVQACYAGPCSKPNPRPSGPTPPCLPGGKCLGPPPPTAADETAFKEASRPFVMCHKGKFKCNAVLIHGLGASPYSVSAVAEHLMNSGCNVVAGLLSGHGADSIDDMTSQASDYLMTKENWNRDYENTVKLAQRLFGKKSFFIGGYSAGGAVALDYLKMHPNAASSIAGMILLDPAIALPCTDVKLACVDTVKGALGEGLGYGLINFYARNVLRKDDRMGSDTPVYVPLYHPMEAAAAIGGVIKEITAPETFFDTPTIAFFSSGYSDTPGVKTTDAQEGRKILCGQTMDGGTPSGGKLTGIGSLCPVSCGPSSLRYHSLRHNQMPLSSESLFGRCAPEGLKNQPKHNPLFSCMMDQIVGFIDQQKGANNSVAPSRLPIH